MRRMLWCGMRMLWCAIDWGEYLIRGSSTCCNSTVMALVRGMRKTWNATCKRRNSSMMQRWRTRRTGYLRRKCSSKKSGAVTRS